MARRIEIVPYDPNWERLFAEEAEVLRAVFGEQLVDIHHIGSTAIPGIKAKPTIDILPEVRQLEMVDTLNEQMAKLGYEARGEYGIPGRRYFIRAEGEVHQFHIHTFQSGNPEIARHLNFCAYLRAHPDEAQAYSRLKESLARRFREDSKSYTLGKNDLIREIDSKASQWASEGLGHP